MALSLCAKSDNAAMFGELVPMTQRGRDELMSRRPGLGCQDNVGEFAPLSIPSNRFLIRRARLPSAFAVQISCCTCVSLPTGL